MLTGRRTFKGEAITDTLGAIIHKEPDWEILPEDTPWSVRSLLERCLAKDRKERLQHIGDARIEVNQAIVEPPTFSRVTSLPGTYSKRQLITTTALTGLMVIAVATVIYWIFTQVTQPGEKLVSRYVYMLPEDQHYSGGNNRLLAISPDALERRSSPWKRFLRGGR